MKAKPTKIVDGEQVVCDPKEAQYLELRLPGPSGLICLPVMIGGTREGTRNWTWNGSTESPTLKPSVLLTRLGRRCHSFINDGHVQFLDDCTHDFAGKTLGLLNVTQPRDLVSEIEATRTHDRENAVLDNLAKLGF